MNRSQRLIQLIMMINAKKTFTVQQLADELELSKRTITRDLQELSLIGVPIYSVQGRGGGYRLLQERLLPPIIFSENEAIALFVACHSLQYFSSLPFDPQSALHKLYHYLSEDSKAQIDRLRNKVILWSPGRLRFSDSLRLLMEAVMLGKAVEIEYSSGSGLTRRDIQPIGLYANAGYWYCPAYCFLSGEMRLFRADRIASARLNEAVACREDVSKMTLHEWKGGDEREVESMRLEVELSRNGVRQLENDIWFGSAIERRPDGSGTAAVSISPGQLPFYAELIWRLGEDATVCEPVEAIEYIRRKLAAMTIRYG